MSSADFSLSRNTFGRLVFTSHNEDVYEGVVPVRAFPISDPDAGFALVAADGHELAWIDRLSDLAADTRALLEAELASREFMPQIKRIIHVSSFATPSNWQVETDRGQTMLALKGEEDIRRLPQSMLLIADSYGIQFLIKDIDRLDRSSRKLLDHFL
jgi:hypothetical protein